MAKKIKEPQYYTSALNTPLINYKVYVMNGREKLIYFLITFIAGGLLGLVFYGGLFKEDGKETPATLISNIVVFCLVGLIVSKVFIPVFNEKLKKKRLAQLKIQFRDFLVALSNAISGGMNVSLAFNNAYKDLSLQYSSDALIVKEVGEIINGMQNNISIDSMLVDFGARSGDADIENFATVFKLCFKSGGNLKEVIKRTSDVITTKIAISEEIETKLTSNKMQLSVMEIIPIIIILMMRFMSSDFAESFASPVGVISMTIAIGIFIISYKLGQKIMNIKG